MKTAISGTEHTVTTDDNKVIHRKLISQPVKFQEDSPHAKVARKEQSTSAESKTLPVSDEINAGNWHMLRNVDGKYSRWSEVLEDILKGKSSSKMLTGQGKLVDERDSKIQIPNRRPTLSATIHRKRAVMHP